MDDFGKPQDNQTYTIMMYGCGGGNLDENMMQNIDEAYLIGSSDRVNFIGQVNFSAEYQKKEKYKGTLRFKVGPTPEGEFKPEKYSENVINLSDPQHLTDFINWSKQEAPADNYILLLWNHGKGWIPADDAPQQRGILFDDNFKDQCITLDNIVKGIKDSDTYLKMIYFDACLMGQLEIITGVKDCADYFMGATHVTPGLGGDYNSLMYHLGTTTNFEDSMKEYGRETMMHWNQDNCPLDLKVINLKKMDKFLSETGIFAGLAKEVTEHALQTQEDLAEGTLDEQEMMNAIQLLSKYDNALNKCYQYDEDKELPFYDLMDIVEAFTALPYAPYSAKLVDIASRMNRSWNEAVVCNLISKTGQGHDFSVGVTVVGTERWHTEGYDTTYPNLEFDKLTNWSSWMSINYCEPEGNPNPGTYTPEDNDNEGG
ncbi:MAG: clostripain-related cysteine peptidase, partial [Bacillota bacterium]|nr:clostripain-related cysteine peptidase [Bacillota bacterium]